MGKRAKTRQPDLAIAVLVLSAAVSATSNGQALAPRTPGEAQVATTTGPTHASLSGRWELNPRACEPVQTIGKADEAPPRGRGRSILSVSSQEEMRRVSEPAPVLVIVLREPGYAVRDNAGHELLLRPDGVKTKNGAPGPSLERTTRWEGRALVTETRLSNGARVTQTYTTEDDGLRLVVRTTVAGGSSRNQLAFKWVYDQALQ